MSLRRLLAVCLGLIGVLAAGTGGYLLYVNYTQRLALARRLDSAHTALAQRERNLTEMEIQRQRLAKDEEEARRKLTLADEAAARLGRDRERLNEQVLGLTAARQKDAAAYTNATARVASLEGHLASLTDEQHRLQAEKEALEQAMLRRDQRSLTAAEIEQVSQALTAQAHERARLEQHLAELSTSYEQLAQDRRQLQAGIDAHPPEPGSTWSSQLAAWSTTLRTHEDQMAARYKELGEGYLRIRDYARAAEAFETSLALRDDPALHSQLALLYSRFLHHADRAKRHTAQSREVPSIRPGDSARAQRLPRSGWSLLRDWLTQ